MNHDQVKTDVIRRQRNIAPEDTIRNDAIVEGFLIKGGRALTPVQRIGAILVSLVFLTVGGICLYAGIGILFFEGGPPSIENFIAVCLGLPIVIGMTYIGWRMFWNGIRNPEAHR